MGNIDHFIVGSAQSDERGSEVFDLKIGDVQAQVRLGTEANPQPRSQEQLRHPEDELNGTPDGRR